MIDFMKTTAGSNHKTNLPRVYYQICTKHVKGTCSHNKTKAHLSYSLIRHDTMASMSGYTVKPGENKVTAEDHSSVCGDIILMLMVFISL